MIKDTARAPGGVSGSGGVYAINHNGDNALATLRYRFKSVDFQVAEEPFSAGGATFNRGSFIVRHIAKDDLDKATKELGLRAIAIDAEPQVKMHPARAARIALLHTWIGTQTEGWWRQAFDFLHVPYDYISEHSRAPSASSRQARRHQAREVGEGTLSLIDRDQSRVRKALQ